MLRIGVWIAVLVAALVVSIVGGLYVAGAVMGPRPQAPAAGSVTPGTAATAPATSPAAAHGAGGATGSPSGSGSQGTQASPTTPSGRAPEPAKARVELRVIPDTTVEVGQPVTLFEASVIPPGDSASSYEWKVTGPDPSQAESLSGPQVTFTPKKEGNYRVRLAVTFRQAGRLESEEVTFVATRPGSVAGTGPAPRRTAGPITLWKEGNRVFFMLSSKELGLPEKALVNELTIDYTFGANEQSRFGPGSYLTDTPLVLNNAGVDVHALKVSAQLPNGRSLNETYSFRP